LPHAKPGLAGAGAGRCPVPPPGEDGAVASCADHRQHAIVRTC